MLTVYLITASGKTRLADQSAKGYEISGAVVKQTLNEVSSAKLTFPSTNLFVRSVIGTSRPVIEVMDGDTRVFYGAVVSAKVDIWGNTEFDCDGALSFLSDVVKAPFTVNNKTKAEYIQAIVDQYNAAVSAERQVWFGGVVGFDSENVDIDHSEEYTDTLTLFKEAVEKYGGYIVETFGSGSVHPYVGWMKDPEIDSGKVLEFGVNEITLANQLDFSDYASRVYATGQNGLTLPAGYVSDSSAEAAFGRRDYALKTNASNTASLAVQALAELFTRSTPFRSIELTALDLEQLGHNYSGFVLGTTAAMLDAHFGINMTVMVNTVERDLIDKQNGKIILGRAPATLTNSLVR